MQADYLKCTTKTAQDKFVKENATRWSEFHRLPYFDVCEMIVVDPMHNLFLGNFISFIFKHFCCTNFDEGVVKTHFYHIWVQQNVLRKTKELRRLHAILSDVRYMPYFSSFCLNIRYSIVTATCQAWPSSQSHWRTSWRLFDS